MSMPASLNSQAQHMLAVDISELHTKLVTGKEGSTWFGLVSQDTSGMTSILHDGAVHAAAQYMRYRRTCVHNAVRTCVHQWPVAACIQP